MTEAAEEAEESPVVKRLKEVDDKYLELRREFDRERDELAKRFTEKQKEFLDKRKQLLTAAVETGPKSGTPALTGFWCKAMQQHEALEDKIREWDEPVLEYLADVEIESFDPSSKGFKITFRFAENPYFANKELGIEYHTCEANAYLDSLTVEKVVSSKIDWLPGKDVTVEKVTKKGKKAAKKDQTRVRPSFFREFICNLHKGMTLPEIKEYFAGQIADAEELRGAKPAMIAIQTMEGHFECGCALRDNIVPFAVRWYTGEACVEESDYSDEEEEEEEEDDDEEDDSSNEDEESPDEPPPKAEAKDAGKGDEDAASGPGRGKKNEGAGSPEVKPEQPSKEDCKQQ